VADNIIDRRVAAR